MSREYRHIQQYEKELLKMKEEGLSHQKIADNLGFRKMQVKKFFERYRIKQRKIEAGIVIHKKGRPSKKEGESPPSIQRLDKLAQMRYVLASKDRYIKRLEMENELMRDFLSLAERK